MYWLGRFLSYTICLIEYVSISTVGCMSYICFSLKCCLLMNVLYDHLIFFLLVLTLTYLDSDTTTELSLDDVYSMCIVVLILGLGDLDYK